MSQDEVNRKICWVLTEMLIAISTTENNKNIIGESITQLSDLVTRTATSTPNLEESI